ncbi:hypothetical protein F2P81_015691 [Scophthalmus maximus]|uniref:Uncharacterized protein n=1 Tax=Scophthalmus maximus TaxID=52904 RepID=A0A6A4S7F4_SCOMX|nr:hypothetical protein F2P81_015691 [Scophthalmus maximus]
MTFLRYSSADISETEKNEDVNSAPRRRHRVCPVSEFYEKLFFHLKCKQLLFIGDIYEILWLTIPDEEKPDTCNIQLVKLRR